MKARARGYAGRETDLVGRSRKSSRSVGPVYLDGAQGEHEEVPFSLCDEVLVARSTLFSEF